MWAGKVVRLLTQKEKQKVQVTKKQWCARPSACTVCSRTSLPRRQQRLLASWLAPLLLQNLPSPCIQWPKIYTLQKYERRKQQWCRTVLLLLHFAADAAPPRISCLQQMRTRSLMKTNLVRRCGSWACWLFLLCGGARGFCQLSTLALVSLRLKVEQNRWAPCHLECPRQPPQVSVSVQRRCPWLGT